MIDTIKAAYVQGRLSKDEFDARVGQALGARTRDQLDTLTSDIPAVPRRVPVPHRGSRRGRALPGLLAALAAIGLALLISLPSGTARPAPPPSAAVAQVRMLTFNRDGLEFRYPAAWPAKDTLDQQQDTSQSSFITYLTPSRLRNPCRTWPRPLGADKICRGWPVSELPPGGVLITWALWGWPAGTPVHGTHQTINGHPAIVSAAEPVPTPPGNIGPQLMIQAGIERQPGAGNWYVMTAFLRGPGLSQAEAEVLAIVRSVHLPVPVTRGTAIRGTGGKLATLLP